LIKLTVDEEISNEDLADRLRKAANNLSPHKKREGSRKFPVPAAKELFEHFDNKMKRTIEDIKKDLDKIFP